MTARGRGAAVVVLTIWAALLIANLTMVAVYTTNYPFADELGLLTQRLTPEWLWRQHAEHRVPLAKLIWLGTLRLTNYEFRIGNALSVLMVGAVALAMVKTAAHLRGRVSLLDSFFPLAFLGFGQAMNFLWWWVVNHLLAPMLACCLLASIVRTDASPTSRTPIVTGGCLILLALAGPGGLPYALALAGWLAYQGLCPPSPSEPRRRLLLVAMAVVAAALVGAYFVDYDPMPGLAAGQTVKPVSLWASLKASLQVLAVSFGPAVASHWRSIGLFAALLLAVSVALVLAGLVRTPGERLRALGLLLFAGAAGSLFTVVGRARAGLGEEYALSGVYLDLGLPALCLIYFAWLIYGKPAIGSLVQACLVAITLFLFGENLDWAFGAGQHWDNGRRAFEQDVNAGVPPFILAERHVAFLNPAARDSTPITRSLGLLREARIPQFARVVPDPPFRESLLPVVPFALDGVTWTDGVASSRADDPRRASLSFRLPEPRFVYAIRLQCSYGRRTGEPAALRLGWRADQGASTAGDASACSGAGAQVEIYPPDMWARRFRGGPEKTVTVWVNSTVAEFRICPDARPFAFGVSAIALLVP